MTTAILERNQMRVLSQEGDTKIEWDPHNKDEVASAEKQFNDLNKKGFKAYKMCEGGNKGDILDKFDKHAERILFIPPIAGG